MTVGRERKGEEMQQSNKAKIMIPNCVWELFYFLGSTRALQGCYPTSMHTSPLSRHQWLGAVGAVTDTRVVGNQDCRCTKPLRSTNFVDKGTTSSTIHHQDKRTFRCWVAWEGFSLELMGTGTHWIHGVIQLLMNGSTIRRHSEQGRIVVIA